MRVIKKIGLAVLCRDELLLVRKWGGASFILPGGKPEDSESDLDALNREIREELGCRVIDPHLMGQFDDVAADLVDTRVSVRLYLGSLRGTPEPASEIEEIEWLALRGVPRLRVAPSLANKILPFLRDHISQADRSPKQC